MLSVTVKLTPPPPPPPFMSSAAIKLFVLSSHLRTFPFAIVSKSILTLSKSAIETLKALLTTASFAPLKEVVIVDPLMLTPDIVGASVPAGPAGPASPAGPAGPASPCAPASP